MAVGWGIRCILLGVWDFIADEMFVVSDPLPGSLRDDLGTESVEVIGKRYRCQFFTLGIAEK